MLYCYIAISHKRRVINVYWLRSGVYLYFKIDELTNFANEEQDKGENDITPTVHDAEGEKDGGHQDSYSTDYGVSTGIFHLKILEILIITQPSLIFFYSKYSDKVYFLVKCCL